MGHKGGEPGHAGGEQGERFVRFMVCPAHIENGEFLAAHGGDFEGHQGGGVYAGEDDAAPVAHCADGGVGGVLLGGAIDGAIHTAVGGIGQNLACSVELAGVERRVGAHVEGEFAAMRDGVDRPDAAGAGHFEAGDSKQADGSGAEDGDGFAGLDGGEPHGVHGHGKRLDNGGQFQGEVRRDGEQVRDRQIDELPEEARKAGVAEKPDIGAHVVMAGAAELAVVAIEGRFERGAVAGLPTRDAGPGLDHGAGRFVAQHHGVVAGCIAHRAL